MGANLQVGYTGAYQDPVTEGYPLGNGYRMYLPELMRFAQPDSLSPFGQGGVNPFAYCGDDSINHADPSGHFAFLAEPGLQILAIGLMFIPVTERVGVATEALAALESVDATTRAMTEGTEVLGEAAASTSMAAGAGEDLASARKVWRPYDWDAQASTPAQEAHAPTQAQAPAPNRPTIQDLIQRARDQIARDPREVEAHYRSFIESNVQGVRAPDESRLLLHQFARELEREDIHAKDLTGFTNRKQLAEDLGNSERTFTDLKNNIRRNPSSRLQKAYVLYWCFEEVVDLRQNTIVHVG